MRVFVTFIAGTVLATCVAAATATEPLSVAGTKRASVRVLDCDRGGHQALFRAAMRRVPGTRRMALRFTLLHRDADERFTRVRAPGLSRWKRSRSGVRRFAHRQRVRGLSEGHEYRVRVDLRWLDADGKVIRRGRTSSRTCALVSLPNLRVTGVERALGGYAVGIENVGDAASPQTDIRLSVDGEPQGYTAVPSLAPGELTAVRAAGKPCWSRVRVSVDPARNVWESHEDDNLLVQGCP